MSFSSQIRNWTVRTRRDTRQVVSDVFMQIGTRIIDRTPIGDVTSWKNPPPVNYEPGTLRNSWNTGIGALAGVELREPSTVAADARNQLRSVAPLVPGHIAYIANPAPYASRIEFDSWSPQASGGMVEPTLREFNQIVRQVANASS